MGDYEPERSELIVRPITTEWAGEVCIASHYLHRRPSISYAFGLLSAELFGNILGVVTFGTPPSHHLMKSACRTQPKLVTELNRLWVDDVMGRNTESWFLSRALSQMPARIVVSYADTAEGHTGIVYRASNFLYAGITDMDRRMPRFDYVTEGKHSRSTTRNGTMQTAERVRRKPKHRYWIVTGSRREKRNMRKLATWPVLSWA